MHLASRDKYKSIIRNSFSFHLLHAKDWCFFRQCSENSSDWKDFFSVWKILCVSFRRNFYKFFLDWVSFWNSWRNLHQVSLGECYSIFSTRLTVLFSTAKFFSVLICCMRWKNILGIIFLTIHDSCMFMKAGNYLLVSLNRINISLGPDVPIILFSWIIVHPSDEPMTEINRIFWCWDTNFLLKEKFVWLCYYF